MLLTHSKNPIIVLLVGVPAAGKSTWVADNIEGGVVLSTDTLIEAKAAKRKKTYDQVFQDEIKEATDTFFNDLKGNLEGRCDVVIDRTNLTPNSRAKILGLVPDDYIKIGMVFDIPDPDTLATRLASRPGKHIPDPVIQNMIKWYQSPTVAEGFDMIIREKAYSRNRT